jgi:transcriptional regulator with PAS, ATPase and Fis domain
VIERAVILETTAEVQPTSLPDFELETRLRKSGLPRIAVRSLEDAVANFERDLIVTTLEHQHYSLAKAAGQLKITRHALRYRMNRLDITAPAAPNDEAIVTEPPESAP